jgi:hypothetical protein
MKIPKISNVRRLQEKQKPDLGHATENSATAIIKRANSSRHAHTHTHTHAEKQVRLKSQQPVHNMRQLLIPAIRLSDNENSKTQNPINHILLRTL